MAYVNNIRITTQAQIRKLAPRGTDMLMPVRFPEDIIYIPITKAGAFETLHVCKVNGYALMGALVGGSLYLDPSEAADVESMETN